MDNSTFQKIVSKIPSYYEEKDGIYYIRDKAGNQIGVAKTEQVAKNLIAEGKKYQDKVEEEKRQEQIQQSIDEEKRQQEAERQRQIELQKRSTEGYVDENGTRWWYGTNQLPSYGAVYTDNNGLHHEDNWKYNNQKYGKIQTGSEVDLKKNGFTKTSAGMDYTVYGDAAVRENKKSEITKKQKEEIDRWNLEWKKKYYELLEAWKNEKATNARGYKQAIIDFNGKKQDDWNILSAEQENVRRQSGLWQ